LNYHLIKLLGLVAFALFCRKWQPIWNHGWRCFKPCWSGEVLCQTASVLATAGLGLYCRM